MTMTPQDLAEACAHAMWADDSASQRLGMSLDAVGPGHATLSMTITDHMTNGHGMCHGGYIFTLADSAFAFACNSYNQRVVAQHCAVSFPEPGRTRHAPDRDGARGEPPGAVWHLRCARKG